MEPDANTCSVPLSSRRELPYDGPVLDLETGKPKRLSRLLAEVDYGVECDNHVKRIVASAKKYAASAEAARRVMEEKYANTLAAKDGSLASMAATECDNASLQSKGSDGAGNHTDADTDLEYDIVDDKDNKMLQRRKSLRESRRQLGKNRNRHGNHDGEYHEGKASEEEGSNSGYDADEDTDSQDARGRAAAHGSLQRGVTLKTEKEYVTKKERSDTPQGTSPC